MALHPTVKWAQRK